MEFQRPSEGPMDGYCPKQSNIQPEGLHEALKHPITPNICKICNVVIIIILPP